MKRHTARLLLAIAAAMFATGSILHAAAYGASASIAITRSNLSPLLATELKMLWLADSTTLLTMALIVTFLAVKPGSATRAIVVLLAAIPAATAFLIYLLLGPFYAGHLLLVASVLLVTAGLLTPRQIGPAREETRDSGVLR